MDRDLLRASNYPFAQFVDAFVHVVWLRDAIDPSVASDYTPDFHAAITTAFRSITCTHDCAVCRDDPKRCPRVAAHIFKEIFANPASWCKEGALLPQSAARAHIIATAPPLEALEHCAFSEPHVAAWCGAHARDPTEIGPQDLEWIDYDEDSTAVENVPPRARNAIGISIAVAMLCMHIHPENPRNFYIQLREAFHGGVAGVGRVADVARAIAEVLLGCRYTTSPAHTPPPWINAFATWCERYCSFVLCAARATSIAAIRASQDIECAVTRDHTIVRIDTQSGAYVEVRWPATVMTILECRMTAHLWSRLLGIATPTDMLVKRADATHVAIVIPERDLVRIMRYAPTHLHCARAVSLGMPVYKTICQNYIQANIDRDAAGARMFIADFLSVLTRDVPASATNTHFEHSLGYLHTILAQFADTLSLHAMRPLLDVSDLDLTPPPPGRLGRTHPYLAPQASESSRVAGFAWSSTTLHGAILAFLCIRDPHIIAIDSVHVMYRMFCENIAAQTACPGAMHVVSEMSQRPSRCPTLIIRGTTYVEIPIEMRGALKEAAPPVAYLYAIIASPLFDRAIAAQLFLSIRLCHGKASVGGTSAPFRLAKMRDNGLAEMNALDREYTTVLPSGPYAELYTPARIRDIGCMQYMTFFLEMLTYTQCDYLNHTNLTVARREFGKYGTAPQPPLSRDTYRGMVTPHHIVRHARRDKRDVQTNRHAYEIFTGVFQHEVLPVLRFRPKATACDISRAGGPLHGCDPLIRECVLEIPIARVRMLDTNPRRAHASTNCKRKRGAPDNMPK